MEKLNWSAVRGAGLLALPLIVAGLFAAFVLPPSYARLVTLFLIYVIAVVGNGIYSGNSGIISFGHTAFMAIGAYASALLTINPTVAATALPNLPGWLSSLAGQPLLTGILVAALTALAVAAVIGIPIARLAGSAASIATLGFLIIIHVTLTASGDFTRGSQTFFGVPRETTIWVALPFAIAAVVIARLYRTSAPGLALRAAREDEIAATAIGVNAAFQRYIAWVLGAVLAAVSGALLAHFLGAFSPKDFYFNLTFMLLSMLILGGISTVSGAIGGTALIVIMVELLRNLEAGASLSALALPPVFGLTDIGIGLVTLLVMYRLPEGLFGVREPDERIAPGASIAAGPAERPKVETADSTLQVERVGRRFAGLVALEDVSFEVKTGTITGLIGPNGAGKSTLINAISGVVPASSGRVLIGGRDVTEMPVHRVSSLGLARTFQNIRLFRNLTIEENVLVAARHASAGGSEATRATAEALAAVDLTGFSGRLAGTLPYGAQRRLEIARALALNPRFLLLDEPAAGMNPAETDQLISILRSIAAERKLGLLVVEHDLKLIMRLCDTIVVLNKGQMIASGSPTEIRENPAVIEAYLGRKHATRTDPGKSLDNPLHSEIGA